MRANLEELFYNAGVNPDDLWRAVGEILLVRRNRLKWNTSDVMRHGGPNYKTVGAIERGKVGRVGELTRHAEALGLSIVDVLRSALDKSSTKLTPEAAAVVRHFERTTVAGRQALVTTAQALPDAEGEPPGVHQSPLDQPAKAKRKT